MPALILFQMSVIRDCGIQYLASAEWDFIDGTCGTFMIESLPRMLLCFADGQDVNECIALTDIDENPLTSITNIDDSYYSGFLTQHLPDSIYEHFMCASLANYQGFPLILGGYGSDNNMLEIFNTTENPLRWVDFPESSYPYSSK